MGRPWLGGRICEEFRRVMLRLMIDEIHEGGKITQETIAARYGPTPTGALLLSDREIRRYCKDFGWRWPELKRQAGEIDRDLFCYDDMWVPGHRDAMVFSTTYEDQAVLKTPAVMSGNHPVCSSCRRIDGAHRQQARTAFQSTSRLITGQK
jgi:hypothetical protein